MKATIMTREEFDPLEQLGAVIQGAMRRANEQKKAAKNQQDIVYLDARLQTLQELLRSNLAIKETQRQLEQKKEEQAMEDATKKLVSKALWIEDLPALRTRAGIKEQMILEAIAELDRLIKTREGNAVQVNPEVIKAGYLRNLISEMKKEKKIAPHYRMFQNGGVYGITMDLPTKR